MKVTILAIGKMKSSSPAALLFKQYQERLPWSVTLKEFEYKKKCPPAQLKKEEAKLLIDAIPKSSYVILMDERGKDFSSQSFAKWIETRQTQGDSHLCFIIGGADGADETLLQKAHQKLCLGKMTWPHMLVRPLLLEQLYRAYTIITDHPYHRV